MNSDHNSLEIKVSNLETWAELSAWAVVFGLALEVIIAVGVSDSPTVNKWGTVGVDAIITLGVAGEVLFARKARALSETLKRISDEKIAEANERAARAELELEQLRRKARPRIVGEEFLNALKGQPTARFKISYAPEVSDAFLLASWVNVQLTRAKWPIVGSIDPIRPPDSNFLPGLPPIFSVHGQMFGVTIVPPPNVPSPRLVTFGGHMAPKTIEEIEAISRPLAALTRAFFASLEYVSVGNPDKRLPPDTFHIVIGPKE